MQCDWQDNNENVIRASEEPHNRGLLIDPFGPDGHRRDPEQIYRDVLALIGDSD